jgi:hypothetical protein
MASSTNANDIANLGWVSDFQLFYERVLELFKQNFDAKTRWNNIATYIDENVNLLKNTVYYSIKKNPDRKAIDINYTDSFSDIQKKIQNENSALVKASLIITALHHIVYSLLTDTAEMVLNGKEQMIVITNPEINYYVHINPKIEQNILYHAYILIFALESLFTKHFYIGVDYEYTKKKIELMQLNFEHYVAPESIIFLLKPTDLTDVQMSTHIDLIVCNKYINKILHGASALDLPYMYNEMLANDHVKIKKFTRSLIDTMYFCEFFKKGKGFNDKCSIYDEDPERSAIYFFKVIDSEQQQNLTNLFDELPAHAEVIWNVRKLGQPQRLYALYDVLFLKYFYYKIISTAVQEETSEISRKNVIILYKYVVNEMVRFVFLENNNITNLNERCKQDVDPINNYFIRKQNKIIKLIDIYNMVSVDLETTTPKVKIDELMMVNPFKNKISTLIKRIVYGFVSQNKVCKIQASSTVVWNETLRNGFILEEFKNMHYNYLASMFKDLMSILEARVRNICYQ